MQGSFFISLLLGVSSIAAAATQKYIRGGALTQEGSIYVDISHAYNSSPIKCAVLCNLRESCNSFSFNKTTQCRLYQSLGYHVTSPSTGPIIDAVYITDIGCPAKRGCIQSFNPTMCIVVMETKGNWSTALSVCADAKLQMLTVKNTNKLDMLVQYLLDAYPPLRTFYLGQTDAETEGTWKWVDGALNTQLPFPPEADNNYDGNFPTDGANCAFYQINIGPYDISCQNEASIICELPMD